jgi:hypothetical protein
MKVGIVKRKFDWPLVCTTLTDTMKRARAAERYRGNGEGSSSGSEGESASESESNEQAAALAALEAHFAHNFDVPLMKSEQGLSEKAKGKGKRKQREAQREQEVVEGNFATNADLQLKGSLVKKRSIVSPAPAKAIQTVVFGETNKSAGIGSADIPNGWRKFMSSKVAIKTEEEKAVAAMASKKGIKAKRVEKEEGDEEEDQDEKTAQTNDRALSELLSTTLFAPGGAGSTTERSNGRPILGSNDTLARLLELSKPSMTGKAESQGRGYGAALLKSQEMGKMPVEIRHGMRRAEMESQDKQLQRQKELGNYHHSIKGLMTKREGLNLILGTKEKDRSKRTRDKGLSMGVGKFSGGMLKLSERDIEGINKPSSSHNHKRRK